MQSLMLKTRCFCHFASNYPSISIKTQKMAGSWVVVEDASSNREQYKIFHCGHAIHERCAKIIARLNQEFGEITGCPMCQIDWTRPSELPLLEPVEKDNPNIQYNDCLCKEKIRVFKNQKNEWRPTLMSFKAYPCGHGCHIKCHNLYWLIREKQSEECPLCHPEIENRMVDSLAEHVERLNQQLHISNNLNRALHSEKDNWNKNRYHVAVAVLVVSAVLMRFGSLATSIKTPIPLTKFTLGDLIVCIIAVALSVFTARVLARPN